MEVIRDVVAMQQHCLSLRKDGRSIGLVPTMGALHEGHLSLLRIAREQSDVSVVSIYVNPTQFGPSEDLATYPRPFDRDCELAEQNGCSVIFAPSDESMYAQPYSTHVEVEGITAGLCGAFRPGHFRGVTTVVLKLLNIVVPTVAVFGQKDAQQALVIRRMVRDLNVPVTVMVGPTIREEDGLAVSSRNVYLSAEERTDAALINAGLRELVGAYEAGERDPQALKDVCAAVIARSRMLRIEYLEVVDTVLVEAVASVEGKALVAVACRTTGTNTRLIDNVMLGGEL